MRRAPTETQTKRLGQVPGYFACLRALLALVAFALSWLPGGEAAASERAGMCAPSAQSIEAPPPLYPSSSATVTECPQVDQHESIEATRDPNPNSRLWTDGPIVAQQAVALAGPSWPRPSRTAIAPALPPLPLRSDEHVRSLERPPSASREA
ncbi:MAG TPA: hypothetical protein VLC09_00845 [Polyangiaceae bacterium]|nr:hypothetical protein [Polyangiaceae bacterium]